MLFLNKTVQCSEIKVGRLDKKEYDANGTINVTCKVCNTGQYDGAEVVQVYVGKSKSKVERAVKELKGFKKVYLKKGDDIKITIPIPVENLKYYNEDESKWDLESGSYVVYVGNASNNILQKLKVKVQ